MLTGTILTGGTGTTNFPHIFIQPTGTTASTTWSTAGTLYGGNAPTGFTGNLLDLKLAGVSKLIVNNVGTLSGSAVGQQVYFIGTTLNNCPAAVNYLGFQLSKNGVLSWGNDVFAPSSADATLQRDGAAGILAQREGAQAQTYRWYYSYTDTSNYHRGALSTTSSGITIAAETAGSGADDLDITLTPAGVGKVKSAASVLANSGTAIPAGGTAGAGLMVSSTANFGVFFGSGAPSLSAAKGSLYLRSDGSGIAGRIYVNTNGSTTWTAVATAA
jgi:hypothetical protein